MTSKRTCPDCGASDIPDEALVCSCGADLVDGTAPEGIIELTSPKVDDWSPPGVTRQKMLRYAVVLAGLGLAVAGIVVSSSDDFDALSIVPPEVTTLDPRPTAAATTTSITEAASTTTSSTTTVVVAPPPPPSVIFGVDSVEAVPGAVIALLGEVGVLDHDDFTSDSDRWGLAGHAGRWELLPDRIVVGTRGTAAEGGLRSSFLIEPGTAAVLRLSYSVRTAVKVFLESEAEGDLEYRRFGFRMGTDRQAEAVVTEHFEGSAELTGSAPVGDLVPQAGREYYVTLAVDEGGTLALGVWSVDGDGHAIEIRDLGALWADRSWRMYAGVDQGILFISEFWLVELPTTL